MTVLNVGVLLRLGLEPGTVGSQTSTLTGEDFSREIEFIPEDSPSPTLAPTKITIQSNLQNYYDRSE